ncbi:hypothetical protein SPRG_00920 [Saprolegnia parasitica CBS 223.65]|uniref:EamA domain-containing protein n=1 Tax=Saprolegnia parasitica (strain CBS 223.65) TaxID=695850 RepID=A0A067D021_SAPPC|nr:hypothetical protein SPRG_00920 [Saprolegnia parasitica CBS 223.65]KDO34860.1 hypothetical protein SPRG_00920 [Saprolegnia parasitica CBS 223.65]|eukprot:XP_012194522.1 hypothetical protein SPRG_00920 [Saprolegnia parasitica CBS 223.65]
MASRSGAALVAGTAATLSLKVAFGLPSHDGVYVQPLFQTGLVFSAMALLVPVHYIVTCNGDRATIEKGAFWRLCRPAVIDVLATALAMAGLLYLAPSTHKLLQYSVMPIVALLKWLLKRDDAPALATRGLGLYLVALMCIVVGTICSAPIESSAIVRGLLFLGASCIVQSVLFLVDADASEPLPALLAIGVQGLWGCLFLTLLVFPAAYCMPTSSGLHENVFNTAQVVATNSDLLASALVTLFSTTTFHVVAVRVLEDDVDEVHGYLLAMSLAPSVWIVGILLQYSTSLPVDEPWTGVASMVQLCGMALLLYATTLIHNDAPELPVGVGHRVFAYSSSSATEPHLAQRLIAYGSFKAADHKTRGSFVI